jgi:hypothetical protein
MHRPLDQRRWCSHPANPQSTPGNFGEGPDADNGCPATQVCEFRTDASLETQLRQGGVLENQRTVAVQHRRQPAQSTFRGKPTGRIVRSRLDIDQLRLLGDQRPLESIWPHPGAVRWDGDGASPQLLDDVEHTRIGRVLDNDGIAGANARTRHKRDRLVGAGRHVNLRDVGEAACVRISLRQSGAKGLETEGLHSGTAALSDQVGDVQRDGWPVRRVRRIARGEVDTRGPQHVFADAAAGYRDGGLGASDGAAPLTRLKETFDPQLVECRAHGGPTHGQRRGEGTFWRKLSPVRHQPRLHDPA